MSEFLSFLISNYQLVCLFLISFLQCLLILIKKPTKIDSLKERILEIIPLYVQSAEIMYKSVPKSGLDKLNFVVNAIKAFLRISSTDYDSFIVESVEKVLSTPTKNVKEDLNEK